MSDYNERHRAKLRLIREICERMHERRDALFVKNMTTDDNWNKEKPKMSYTTEQLQSIDWRKLDITVSVGRFTGSCNLIAYFDGYSVSRKSYNSKWVMPQTELATNTLQVVASKCKLIDEFIERELDKKWQPLPPMGCDFVHSESGKIIGMVSDGHRDTICQVGRYSSLLADELIKRDGSKHIDAKRGMLTYQLEWPCEEVSQ